jgi:acyl carrier protein
VSDHDGPVAGGKGAGGSDARGSTPVGPVTFEEFRHIIARELAVEERLVVPGASFEDDLYADSIRLVELLLRLSQQGITIPMEEAWSVRTVAEAYKVYSRHAGGGTPKPDAPSQGSTKV